MVMSKWKMSTQIALLYPFFVHKKKSMLNNGIYLLILVILFTKRNRLVLAKYGEKEEKEKKNK